MKRLISKLILNNVNTKNRTSLVLCDRVSTTTPKKKNSNVDDEGQKADCDRSTMAMTIKKKGIKNDQ